jgi:hypothetical protein
MKVPEYFYFRVKTVKHGTAIEVENASDADVVEVVRCKDCTHYNAGFECLIEGYGIERDKDWYCADAERRTDE